MISIPGSLSFAKLAMMSSAPAKSAGVPDMRPKIQSFVDRSIVPYNIDSKRNYESVLSTSNAIVIILVTFPGLFLYLCTTPSTSFHEVKPTWNLRHSSCTVRRQGCPPSLFLLPSRLLVQDTSKLFSFSRLSTWP